MKIDLEINNLSDSPVKKIPFEKIVETVLKKQADFLQDKNVSINLTFVSEENIRELNEKHRRQNSSTDILSFSEYESQQEIKKETSHEVFLGELILCYDDIEKYCLAEEIGLKQEVINIFIHGLLHLLGLDHGEEMFALQKNLVEVFFKK